MCPSVPTVKVFLAVQGSLLVKGNCWMCTVKAVSGRLWVNQNVPGFGSPKPTAFWVNKNGARSFEDFSFKAG